jgi:hypothetical protein
MIDQMLKPPDLKDTLGNHSLDERTDKTGGPNNVKHEEKDNYLASFMVFPFLELLPTKEIIKRLHTSYRSRIIFSKDFLPLPPSATKRLLPPDVSLAPTNTTQACRLRYFYIHTLPLKIRIL